MKLLLIYRTKIMLRNRTALFWMLVFPIALMTLFGLVLRSSYTYTEFQTSKIVMVENEQWQQNTTLQTVLDNAKSGDSHLFKVEVTSEEKAKSLLDNDKIDAYIICDDTYDIYVKTSGFTQTIIQTFFDEYRQKESMVEDLMHQGASMEDIQKLFATTTNFVNENANDHMDMTNVYFYTGLAMSALFGGRWAIYAIRDIQADQSQKGARISLAPTNKAIHLFTALILNLIFSFLILCSQFAYIYFAFHVNFENLLPAMLSLLLCGNLAGSALGSIIGCLFSTKNPEEKVSVLSSITMLGSFLSGMMMVSMKWIIQHYVPLLHYINPVSLLTDGMYALYYYGVSERFYINIIALLIFSLICYVICFFTLSKKQYKALGVR